MIWSGGSEFEKLTKFVNVSPSYLVPCNWLKCDACLDMIVAVDAVADVNVDDDDVFIDVAFVAATTVAVVVVWTGECR